MAGKGLPATYLKAAWKTKGATKKNALKRAWAAYRKAKGKTKSKSSSKAKKSGKNVSTNRKPRQMTIPLALVAPIAATLTWCYQSHDKWEGRLNLLMASYTGYDPGLQKWRPDLLKRGLGSLIIGALVHKFVGGAPLNVNRMLGAAKVPFIRI